MTVPLPARVRDARIGLYLNLAYGYRVEGKTKLAKTCMRRADELVRSARST